MPTTLLLSPPDLKTYLHFCWLTGISSLVAYKLQKACACTCSVIKTKWNYIVHCTKWASKYRFSQWMLSAHDHLVSKIITSLWISFILLDYSLINHYPSNFSRWKSSRGLSVGRRYKWWAETKNCNGNEYLWNGFCFAYGKNRSKPIQKWRQIWIKMVHPDNRSATMWTCNFGLCCNFILHPIQWECK